MIILQQVKALETGPGSARKVSFTFAARRALAAVCRRDGQQALVLAWPAGVSYLPHRQYVPQAFDVILGHVVGCPIYVDTRRLALFRDQHIVLDTCPGAHRVQHPTLAAWRAPAHEPGQDTAATGIAAAVDSVRTDPGPALLHELAAQFVGTFSDEQIAMYVRNAISDLQGSVSAEALPEMAARLAHYRLCLVMGSHADPVNDDRACQVTNGPFANRQLAWINADA
jgi:hypothetical protein